MPVKSPLYDRDFYAWSRQQAELLRKGKLADADIEHIAEEIDSMGRTEKRELTSRLSVLLLHLLKWRYQPEKRSPSWEASVRVQRNRLADHLDDNPSLKPVLPNALASAYRDASLEAVAETGLPSATFPEACPWTVSQVLDGGFGRGEGDRSELEAPYPFFPAILAISRMTMSVPLSLSASFSKSSVTTMRISGRT